MKSKVVCGRYDCVNNNDHSECKLKYIAIDKNGKCSSYNKIFPFISSGLNLGKDNSSTDRTSNLVFVDAKTNKVTK